MSLPGLRERSAIPGGEWLVYPATFVSLYAVSNVLPFRDYSAVWTATATVTALGVLYLSRRRDTGERSTDSGRELVLYPTIAVSVYVVGSYLQSIGVPVVASTAALLAVLGVALLARRLR